MNHPAAAQLAARNAAAMIVFKIGIRFVSKLMSYWTEVTITLATEP